MINRIPSVLPSNRPRFWTLAAWFLLSGFLVQPANAGLYNAFVTKLNPTGTGLLYSTYLGGSSSDSANAIAVDSLDNVFVAGLAQSTNFPVLNAFQTVNGGSYGGFVSKISPGWVAAVFLNGSWYVDRNRNGGFDGTSAGDQVFTFGQSGDVPVAGDWTGSGTVKIGVFRGGQWLLDCNGNGVWDGVAGGDNGYYFGNSSYKPVVGDWTGSGTTKAGLFINGTWYLDTIGNGQWTPGTDQTAYFGQAGDIPVVGDWSGSGTAKVGVIRNGYWIVDMVGNGVMEGIGIGESAFWLGNSSFTPIVMH